MSDNTGSDRELLTAQLTAIQEQLTKLNERFDRVEHDLRELSTLPEKIDRLEKDLLLSSDVYRYRNLQQYLAAENWFEADKETVQLVLAITNREIEELTPEDIRHLPCKDLMTIDRLWRQYSNDRFGFSIQLQTYQQIGGTFK
jgi:hypothetical protein